VLTVILKELGIRSDPSSDKKTERKIGEFGKFGTYPILYQYSEQMTEKASNFLRKTVK
jgi:hypothetical protein